MNIGRIMANKSSINIPLIVVATLLLVSLGVATYYKYNSQSTTTVVSMFRGETEESASLSKDIKGRVISINTNAKNQTFIKVKNISNKTQYTLSTYLDTSQLNFQIGDVISFSKDLEKSQNGAYYLINATHEFDVIEKNNAKVKLKETMTELSSISPDMQGHKVTTFGSVSDLYTSSKGHTFFTITHQDTKLKGVLFSAENDDLKGRLELLKKYNNTNEKIYFKGQVDIYKDELEIIVAKLYKCSICTIDF